MNPERWQKIEKIFQSALERATDERAAFLDEECAGDGSLRQEVESLIAADREAGSFIDLSASGFPTRLSTDEQEESASGRRIGPYRVTREIGRGGMGTVYLAARADDQYHKRVAIKLIRRGMDTQDIVRRFRNERQILAALDHPNIARLLDGGTTDDDLPYFVMEYIEGKPLIDYCDAHKLNTGERLKLFRNVCSALQYAHRNLIVHRDIKPGNILVTADGTVKLLDFGIAKLLNPELGSQTIDPTATAMRLMTPDYASPEQVRGEQITTSSDVYSLGVVLYELLTGHRPYQLKSRLPHELLRVICEEEPERPSTAISREEQVTTSDGAARITITPDSVSKTREGQPDKLRRRLVGDLDNIVLKALRKEPQRRYSSVEQFSDDIRRHLEGRPVIARKDTLWYRSSKFIKRHKAGAVAAAVIALTLFAGIATTLWQARVASQQRARAEQRFNDVRRLANSFMFEVHDAIQDLPGSTKARELLVKRALEYLDSLAKEAGDDPSLQRELATAYERVGDVQGPIGIANLGQTSEALESYRKALAIRGDLAKSGLTSTETQLELAKSYGGVGVMLSSTGDKPGALTNCRKALAISEAVSAADPANVQAHHYRAAMYKQLSRLLFESGEMIESLNKAATILESLLATDAKDTELRRLLAKVYSNLGTFLQISGEKVCVLENHRKALAIFEALSVDDPMSAQARSELATMYYNIGGDLQVTNDTVGALENYRRSLAVFELLAVADPANVEVKYQIARGHDAIGLVLAQTKAFCQALESFRKSLRIHESLTDADPANTLARRYVAYSYDHIGSVFKKTGDTARALENFRKSLAIYEALSASGIVLERRNLAQLYIVIGGLLGKTGSTTAAIESFNKALPVLESLLAVRPADAPVQRDLAETCSNLGKAYGKLASDAAASGGKRAGRWREARSWYQRSLDVYLDLRNRGSLADGEGNKPDEITKEIDQV